MTGTAPQAGDRGSGGRSRRRAQDRLRGGEARCERCRCGVPRRRPSVVGCRWRCCRALLGSGLPASADPTPHPEPEPDGHQADRGRSNAARTPPTRRRGRPQAGAPRRPPRSWPPKKQAAGRGGRPRRRRAGRGLQGRCRRPRPTWSSRSRRSTTARDDARGGRGGRRGRADRAQRRRAGRAARHPRARRPSRPGSMSRAATTSGCWPARRTRPTGPWASGRSCCPRRRRTSSPTGWRSCRASAAPATRCSPSCGEDRADLVNAQATADGGARARQEAGPGSRGDRAGRREQQGDDGRGRGRSRSTPSSRRARRPSRQAKKAALEDQRQYQVMVGRLRRARQPDRRAAAKLAKGAEPAQGHRRDACARAPVT